MQGDFIIDNKNAGQIAEIARRVYKKQGISAFIPATVKEVSRDEFGKNFATVEKPLDDTLVDIANPHNFYLLPGNGVYILKIDGKLSNSCIAFKKDNPIEMDISFDSIVGTALTLTFTSPYTDVTLTSYIYSTLEGRFIFEKSGFSDESLTGEVTSVAYSTSGGYPTATATITLDSAGSVDGTYTLKSTYLSPAGGSGGGGGGTDPNAIHDNVAGEINAITSKSTPVDTDLLLIEDSEDLYNKKKITLDTLSTNYNLDGGRADTNYGGTTGIDGGGA